MALGQETIVPQHAAPKTDRGNEPCHEAGCCVDNRRCCPDVHGARGRRRRRQTAALSQGDDGAAQSQQQAVAFEVLKQSSAGRGGPYGMVSAVVIAGRIEIPNGGAPPMPVLVK
jgi:hypothetical protein